MREAAKKYVVTDQCKIKDAMNLLEQISGYGLIVVDSSYHLLGTVTDGDIRRGLLRGVELEENILAIVFDNPTVGSSDDSESFLASLVQEKDVSLIPIIENDVVVDIYIKGQNRIFNIPVVIMAGGLGSRLGELTKDCPKPMLHVGGKPILEHILSSFIKSGFSEFYLSVNYKAEMIENYFGDGELFNCSISYLREKKRLGTAGSLSLLPDNLQGPMIVINGDLIIDFDFSKLIDFHVDHDHKITLCTREYQHQIPFGVINASKGIVESFSEKPVVKYNVNSGVYVIDSSLLRLIPDGQYYDMSTFMAELLVSSVDIQTFPLVENWVDVGREADLHHVRKQFIVKDL